MGKGLLQFTDGPGKNATTYRLTADSRRNDLKTTKLKRLLNRLKNDFGRIENKTVQQIESELSPFNHKTLNWDFYFRYLTVKNSINQKLAAFYDNRILRKNKFSAYVGQQKAKSRLKNDLLKKFGSDVDNVVMCIGDFSQGNRHMRNHVPVKGIGFRNELRDFCGYTVGLVPEFRTSRNCMVCANQEFEGLGHAESAPGNHIGECVKFLYIDSPNKKKQWTQQYPCNGVLQCQTCGMFWGRDKNSAGNMQKCAENAIFDRPRDRYLERPEVLAFQRNQQLQLQQQEDELQLLEMYPDVPNHHQPPPQYHQPPPQDQQPPPQV
jgi:hypothetical protein